MKDGVEKYVKIVRQLFIIFNVIAIPAFMVCLVFAFSSFIAFYFIAPAVGILYFTIYGLYTMRVSLGVVIGVEVTEQVIHLKTPRKTFTYDAKTGCVAMKVYKNRFVGTFETQDSRDKFTFYRHPPFIPYSAEQFTAADMERIYPNFVYEDRVEVS